MESDGEYCPSQTTNGKPKRKRRDERNPKARKTGVGTIPAGEGGIRSIQM